MKLKVHNAHGLPTMPYSQFVDFQGDLKTPPDEESMSKLKSSLKVHGVFVPKFVWKNKSNPYILDGHQTKLALESLEKEGWEIPEIPYVEVKAKNKKDAAEKLLQLNSRYGKFNNKTSWFAELSLDDEDISRLLATVDIPEIDIDALLSDIDFDVPDAPVLPDAYKHLAPSQDQALKPTPLEDFDDEDDDEYETNGRAIIIFQSEIERDWLSDHLGISISEHRVVFTVKDIKEGLEGSG